MKWIVGVVAIVAVIGIGAAVQGGDDKSDPQPHLGDDEPSAQGYALDVAEEVTGERRETGCLEVTKVEHGDYVASGSAAEENAGCVFSAAFAGCLEGETGKPVGGRSYKQEFPEPGLQRIYRQARNDCA